MRLKKTFVIIFSSVLFAIFLGVYAQKIASFFTDDLYMIILVFITIISIILFAVAIILEFMILTSGKVESKFSSMILTVILLVTVIIGFFVSWWTVFVMAMSWG